MFGVHAFNAPWYNIKYERYEPQFAFDCHTKLKYYHFKVCLAWGAHNTPTNQPTNECNQAKCSTDEAEYNHVREHKCQELNMWFSVCSLVCSFFPIFFSRCHFYYALWVLRGFFSLSMSHSVSIAPEWSWTNEYPNHKLVDFNRLTLAANHSNRCWFVIVVVALFSNTQ